MQRINDEGRTCFWWPERWDIFHSPLSVPDSSTALTTVSLTRGSALLWVWQSKIVYVSKQVMGKSVAQHHIWALSQSVWKKHTLHRQDLGYWPIFIEYSTIYLHRNKFPFPMVSLFSLLKEDTHGDIILYYYFPWKYCTKTSPLAQYLWFCIK